MRDPLCVEVLCVLHARRAASARQIYAAIVTHHPIARRAVWVAVSGG